MCLNKFKFFFNPSQITPKKLLRTIRKYFYQFECTNNKRFTEESLFFKVCFSILIINASVKINTFINLIIKKDNYC